MVVTPQRRKKHEAAGNPDKAVMEISGHKTRSIFDRYDIVSDADIESVGQRTAEILEGAKGGLQKASAGQISPSVVVCRDVGSRITP